MKLGIAGAGYWGSKIVNSASNQAIIVIMDIKHGDSWQNKTLDAVIIATPADQHYAMTKWYLEQGIHVLCEKPTCMSVVEQQELNDLAKSQNLVYQAGHILLFQPNIEYMLNLASTLTVRHIESRRLNWGRLQTNIDLAWHLAPHDISVIDKLTNSVPLTIDGTGTHLNSGPQYDYAQFGLTYPDKGATITLGWQWPNKVREFVITCDECQIWLDDTALHITEGGYSNGDLSETKISSVQLNPKQSPLSAQIEDFMRCVDTGNRPRADMDHMLRVTQTVELMSRKLNV
jgi:UDP-2-acetamido-3-amino-2,3-dideoxy-glucuronate N-acetyltransferase